MRTVFLDPQSPLLSGTGYIPPDDPHTTPLPEDDWGFDPSPLRDVKLASIREFAKRNPTDALILERAYYDGWSLRELADAYGGNAGNLTRKLPRLATRLRRHVLADVAAWRLDSWSGFVLSLLSASPIEDSPLYAVNVGGKERLFNGRPRRGEIEAYLARAWKSLHEPCPCAYGDSLHTCYFGGTYKESMNATVLSPIVLADYDIAQQIARDESQSFIYDTMLDVPIRI